MLLCAATINLFVFLLFFSPIMLCVLLPDCSRVLCPDDNVFWLLSSPLHPPHPPLLVAAVLSSCFPFPDTFSSFLFLDSKPPFAPPSSSLCLPIIPFASSLLFFHHNLFTFLLLCVSLLLTSSFVSVFLLFFLLISLLSFLSPSSSSPLLLHTRCSIFLLCFLTLSLLSSDLPPFP